MKNKLMLILLFFISTMIVGCNNFFGESIKTENINDYNKYFGEVSKTRDKEYFNISYEENEGIFPNNIPESAEVKGFSYNYSNISDPNTVAFLDYICSKEDYEKEKERLTKLNSNKEYTAYGIEGFKYPLVALYGDEYSGLIYALDDKDNDRLIYVQVNFCNYFSDIPYENIINKEYLPIGFDAKEGNETRKAFEEGNIK